MLASRAAGGRCQIFPIFSHRLPRRYAPHSHLPKFESLDASPRRFPPKLYDGHRGLRERRARPKCWMYGIFPQLGQPRDCKCQLTATLAEPRWSAFPDTTSIGRNALKSTNDSLTTKSMEIAPAADNNSTNIVHLARHDDSPSMVTLHRNGKELVAIGADDAEDAARQVTILALKMEGRLRIGDVIRISRI
jgi:hypothetical protein